VHSNTHPRTDQCHVVRSHASPGTYSQAFFLVFEVDKLVFWNLEALQSVVQFVAPVTVGDDRAGTVDDDVHERQAEGFGSDSLLPLGVVFSPQRADVRVFNLLHYARSPPDVDLNMRESPITRYDLFKPPLVG
jgi:hypothetical protein